jgi:hypothetical protein
MVMPYTTILGGNVIVTLTEDESKEIRMAAAMNTKPIAGKTMGECFQLTLIEMVLAKIRKKNGIAD